MASVVIYIILKYLDCRKCFVREEQQLCGIILAGKQSFYFDLIIFAIRSKLFIL